MANIFVSYKRNIEPDTPVAAAVYEALCQDHKVFIDTTIQVGEKWAERIQKEIKESDYLICFLSENSVHSEMVVAEIETAHHHRKTYGKPSILPVRLNFNNHLVYPLNAYLNPLQWAVWNTEADTAKLILDLKQVISGGHLADNSYPASQAIQRAREAEFPTAFANISLDLGSPEGTMPHQSPFYIERETDRDAVNSLREIKGVTITIKGPRQMGKSSLLNRLLLEANSIGARAAFIDFQLFETAAIEDAGIFYRQFCSLLSREFGVEDRTEEDWNKALGQVQNTTYYMHEHLLNEIKDASILLAMDEVERMFASPFRSDFFSMLRNWHNNRAKGGDWRRLNLALVTSTEPYQFIANMNQSPFNVGQVVELSDLTIDQVFDLNSRHNKPLGDEQVNGLYELIRGHPYLTRRALYLVASQRTTFPKLLENAYDDDGPFGDHLRNYLFRMGEHKKLKDGLTQIIKSQRCQDQHVFFQLRGSGLVKRVDDKIILRNPLYTGYFGRRLHG